MLLLFALGAYSYNSDSRFMTTSYHCLDRDCSKKEPSDLFFVNEVYEIQVSVTKDGSHSHEEMMSMVKIAGIKPYVVPLSYDTSEKLNSSEEFRASGTSWSWRLSPITAGNLCYRIIPSFTSHISVEPTTVCFMVSDGNTGIMKDPMNKSKLGEMVQYETIAVDKEPIRLVQQPYSKEFIVVQYEDQMPGPIFHKNALLYSPDDFKTLYLVCATPTVYLNVSVHLQDAVVWDGHDALGTISSSPLAWLETVDKAAYDILQNRPNTFQILGMDLMKKSWSENGEWLVIQPCVDWDTGSGWYIAQVFNHADQSSSYLKFISTRNEVDEDESLYLKLPKGYFIHSSEFVADPMYDYAWISVVEATEEGKWFIMKTGMNIQDGKIVAMHDEESLTTRVPSVLSINRHPRSLVSYSSLRYDESVKCEVVGIKVLNSIFRNYVLFYGNILAVSSSYGFSPTLIASFGDKKIERLVTAKRGPYFAFLTNDMKIMLGSVLSSGISEIDYRADMDAPVDANKLLMLFDDNDEFVLIDASSLSNRKRYSYKPSDVVTSKEQCPYKDISVNVWNTDHFSRVAVPGIDTQLPKHVYIDSGDEMHIQIAVATLDNHIPELFVTESKHINVSLETKYDESLSMAIYDVIVRDATTFSDYQADPNYSFTDRLTINFPEANPSCKHYDQTMEVTIGCVPAIELIYEPGSAINELDMKNSAIDLINFDPEWTPQLYLYDRILDKKTPYTGLFKIEIIGGGDSVDTTELYSQDQIEDYNYHDGTRVWAYSSNDKSKVADSQNSSISWACDIQSPCGRVIPNGGAPKFYFLFRVTTIPVPDDRSSLCVMTCDFMVKLHGIPMDIYTMSICMCGSIVAFGTFILILFACFQWGCGNEKCCKCCNIMKDDDDDLDGEDSHNAGQTNKKED